jgi:hypothetical protein
LGLHTVCQGTMRPVHTHVYCSTFHNSQALETARCPTSEEWVKKVWYIYTIEYYSPIKKSEEWNYVVCRKMDGSGEHHVKQKKRGSKGQSHFSLILKTRPKRQMYT